MSVRTASKASRLIGMATGLGLALGLSAPAWAQGGGGSTPLPGEAGSLTGTELPPVPAPRPPPSYGEGMLLGDPGGIRTRLYQSGIDLELTYTGEFGGNLNGTTVTRISPTLFSSMGAKTGSGYAGQIAFSNDIDWEKLAGLAGFNTHLVLINRNGNNLSRNYGDFISQSAEIYGAGFNTVVHLVRAYAEQKLFGDRLNIAAGNWDVGADFAVTLFACIPIALTPGCGHPRVLDNQQGFTNWPQSSLGGRIRGRLSPYIYVQAGIWESKPFPGGGTTGFNWFPGTATGVYFPVEIGWEPIFGIKTSQLPGHYKAGFTYDTSRFPNFVLNTVGVPIPTSNNMLPQSVQGRATFYFVFDQLLYRLGPADDQGVGIAGSWAHATPSNTFNSDTLWGLIGAVGMIPGRPHDGIYATAGWYGISNRVSGLQSIQLDLGEPTLNGVTSPQRSEYVFEAGYVAPIYRGITVQPAVQYFLYPNAENSLNHAWVIAGRLNINF